MVGGVVLAGGRSERMGTAKAALEWHGSTLAYRVAGLVARGTGGPVVVVRARGQRLPALPAGVRIAEDTREGRGPLQGIAAGLAALDGDADVAFVAAVDMPLLHPAFVAAVCAGLEGADVALPVVGGRAQPLAAAYRTALHALASDVAAGARRGTAELLARCRVRELDRLPHPESVTGVNDPQAYADTRAQPAPLVRVDGRAMRAATLGAAGGAAPVRLDGAAIAYDPQLPLAEGDRITLG